MLNVEENLLIIPNYLIQEDFFIKTFAYAFSLLTIIEIIRNQVPEINLLQLVPGVYLFLLFIIFLFLIFISNSFLSLPGKIETRFSFGTKTISKMNFFLSLRLSFFLFFFFVLFSLITIIQVSLDSFNNYGEKTLENLWSLTEVINLEIILLFILILFSQLPIFSLFFLKTEKNLKELPLFWKPLILFIFILSGFLTPTIDGYTQLNFSISAFSIYLFIISLLKKRNRIKYNGISIFGF
jgi:hypothetical protein